MTPNTHPRATSSENASEISADRSADTIPNAVKQASELQCLEPLATVDTENRQFHLFNRLDEKLRLKIWLLAHDSSSRTVQVRLQGFPNGIYYRQAHSFPVNEPWEILSCQIPTLLAVCQESRNTILPKYSTPFDNTNVRVLAKKRELLGEEFLFCWDTDLLVVDIEEYWAEGDYLPRIFTEIFGHHYTAIDNPTYSSPSTSLVKQQLRRLGGNFEVWNRALGNGTLCAANATFFEDFSNLEEVVFVPYFQRRIKDSRILARCDEFEGEVLRGPWGPNFQREFRRGLLKWVPRQLDLLKRLRNDNLGMDEIDLGNYYNEVVPVCLPPTASGVSSFNSFTLFPHLPPELRAQIWRFAFPPQRYIEIVSTTMLDDYLYTKSIPESWHAVSSECVPVLFFVNQEARAEILRYYQPLKGNDNYPTIYSNLKLDVLCFYYPRENTLSTFLDKVSDCARKSIANIQGLRMRIPNRIYSADLARLPNLQEIRVDDDDQMANFERWRLQKNQPRTIGWEDYGRSELTEDEEKQLERWGLGQDCKRPSIRFGQRIMGGRAFCGFDY